MTGFVAAVTGILKEILKLDKSCISKSWNGCVVTEIQSKILGGISVTTQPFQDLSNFKMSVDSQYGERKD
jgi:hypothetical protein